jgi:hypothetical protein
MILDQDVPQPTITQIRLNNITTCLNITADTLGILTSSLNIPFLPAISNTTQSLLKNVQVNSTKSTVTNQSQSGIADYQTKQKYLYRVAGANL